MGTGIKFFSIGGFTFFLLIILVGYIFVELIEGEKYIFRKSIERYKGDLSILDRLIHYGIWGFVWNIAIFFIFNRTGVIDVLSKTEKNLEKIAESLSNYLNIEPQSVFLVILVITYFTCLVVFLVVINLIIWVVMELIKTIKDKFF